MSNPIVDAITVEIRKHADAANGAGEKLRAARNNDSASVAKKYVKSTELAEVPSDFRTMVEEFRAKEAKALAAIAAGREKIEAHIVANLPKSDLSEDESAALNAAYSENLTKFRSYVKSLKDMGIASEDEVNELPKVKSLGGKAGGGTGTNSSLGRPKPRFSSITVNGESVERTVNGKSVVTPTVTIEVLNGKHKDDESWTKVTGAELVDAIFAAAGTQELTEPVTLKSFRGEYDLVFTPKTK